MALSTQRASTSRTSAEWAPPHWKHHVFLSFRGKDTRVGFISHLYHELHYWQAMKTFKDDRVLEIGASISQELLTAIEQSHLAIIVLSPNYASSTWCLDELSKILECMQGTNRIMPIFFGVDPSTVRDQRGSFAQAFTKHEESFRGDVEKLKRWRDALTKVAGLSGLHSKNYKSCRCERELIEDIVKSVLTKVNPTRFTLLDSQQKLVGIDFALGQLRLQLNLEANDVRFIGIWGMGGVGKTTLANLVVERISHNFELISFLSNVREVSAKHGTLVDLQKQLLHPILRENIFQVTDERSGISFTKRCLCNKKVLIILDDVDQVKQLETLVGGKNWFGLGSRIVITTRDVRVLVEYGITKPYEVKVLNDDDEALVLFSQNAFKQSRPKRGFLELSKCFLHYAKGLPLALKTLGCSLYKRGPDTWNSVLSNLKKIRDPKIFDSLKVSYYGLEEKEKKCFLHVACFLRGKCKKEVIEILDRNLDFSSRIVINKLIEKSLLTVGKTQLTFMKSFFEKVQMHDLIQEMALEIVRQEPGQRSLLWLRDDISFVFRNNMGTEAIEAIVLHLPELEEVHWDCTRAFSKMLGLRFLEFDNVIISAPEELPNSLRTIRWSWYPSKSLPSKFEPCSLVELKMRHSKLFQLWDGAKEVLPKLKSMDLSYSDNLISTPPFTDIPNLEILCLQNCTNLVDVHPSFAVHKRLKVLELSGCKNITSLPSEVEMDSLENFDLSGCSKVKKVPKFVGEMNNLSYLFLGGTAIEEIPSSIKRLAGLTILDIGNCKSLLGLSSEICNLKCLTKLNMEGCSYVSWVSRVSLNIDKMPGEMEREPLFAKPSTSKESRFYVHDPWRFVLSSLNCLGYLISLDLSYCNIGVIPDDIGLCSSLQDLGLGGNNFVSLPSSIGVLSKLWHLSLERCERLEQLPDLPSTDGLHVNVNDCTSLKRLSDPSRLGGGANAYDFTFSCLNCFKLVKDEGWIHRIFFWIMKAEQGMFSRQGIICPGSEIPKWFSNQSSGDSINVELPLPPQSCGDWLGIALCFVFEDSEYVANPAAPVGYDHFKIQYSGGKSLYETFKVGHLGSQHLWVFYYHRCLNDASSSRRFSFETHYSLKGSPNKILKTSSNIKKCGARLVYESDLEKFCKILKVPKPAPPSYDDDDDDEPGIGSSNDDYEGGIGNSDDDYEGGIGNSDDDDELGIGSSDDENEAESYSSDDDDEPISKRFKRV